MLKLLQIVFRQDIDTYNSNGGHGLWWDISKDFILPLVLGGLAAYMIYFIFIKETKRDKANEEAKKAEERSDKLIFFSALIESALRSSVQQNNNIKNQIRSIKNNDVEFQLMTQVPLYDLKRITEVLHLEDYLLAYTNFYNIDRTASVKEFKNIVASIDFLYDIFKQIIDQLQKSQMFDYERKTRLQETFAHGYNLLGKLMILFERNDPQSHAEVLQLYQDFSANHPGDNYDLTFYQNYFFIPFNYFCTNYFASKRRVIQEVLDLAIYTRDGKQLYDQVKSENRTIKESLIGDFKNVYKTLLELRENSKNLLRDF